MSNDHCINVPSLATIPTDVSLELQAIRSLALVLLEGCRA